MKKSNVHMKMQFSDKHKKILNELENFGVSIKQKNGCTLFLKTDSKIPFYGEFAQIIGPYDMYHNNFLIVYRFRNENIILEAFSDSSYDRETNYTEALKFVYQVTKNIKNFDFDKIYEHIEKLKNNIRLNELRKIGGRYNYEVINKRNFKPPIEILVNNKSIEKKEVENLPKYTKWIAISSILQTIFYFLQTIFIAVIMICAIITLNYN